MNRRSKLPILLMLLFSATLLLFANNSTDLTGLTKNIDTSSIAKIADQGKNMIADATSTLEEKAGEMIDAGTDKLAMAGEDLKDMADNGKELLAKNTEGLQGKIEEAVDAGADSLAKAKNELKDIADNSKTVVADADTQIADETKTIVAQKKSVQKEPTAKAAIDLSKVSTPSEKVIPSRKDIPSRKVGTLYFAFNSVDLNAQSKGALDQIAKAHKGQQISVTGFTDAVGDSRTNQLISAARANSVVKYLVSKGIDSDLISRQSLGTQRAAADNATSAGRSENRRVEITFN